MGIEILLRGAVKEYGISERLVEYPFIYRNLPKASNTGIARISLKPVILDVGSLGSSLGKFLGDKGYDVIESDIRLEKRDNFVLCDARYLPFRDDAFDVCIAVSTIEHVGLICYGFERWNGYTVDEDGDLEALEEITRVGKLALITVPYGLGNHYWMRIYDNERLTKLLKGKDAILEFYASTVDGWEKVDRDYAERVINVPLAKCVACLRVMKRGD